MHIENHRGFIYQERRNRIERRKKQSRRNRPSYQSNSSEQRDYELTERRSFCRRW